MAPVLPTVMLPKFLEAALAAGHPWVYRDHVPRQFTAPSGTWVRVCAGRSSAFGLWDATSPIALRLFVDRSVPDPTALTRRVRTAWDLREPLRAAGVTAYRWLYGEGDQVPGVVVDLYRDVAVLVTYADAVEPVVPWVVAALGEVTSLRAVVRRPRAPEARPAGLELLAGTMPPADFTVTEYGIHFHVDLAHGQKTGLFLDHRENRRTVGEMAAGRRVLNLFAYTGGFSLAATRGGAHHVTSVDSASPAINAACDNYALNGFSGAEHAAITEDAFQYLERARSAGQRFDLVITDPPSFARSRGQQAKALRSYVRLHAAAMRVVAPGGLYAAASCTSQVGPADFRETLAEGAARARRTYQIIHEAGQPLDHPVLAQHPEGRYLKFLVGRVLGDA